jgi:hypothetical protein
MKQDLPILASALTAALIVETAKLRVLNKSKLRNRGAKGVEMMGDDWR